MNSHPWETFISRWKEGVAAGLAGDPMRLFYKNPDELHCKASAYQITLGDISLFSTKQAKIIFFIKRKLDGKQAPLLSDKRGYGNDLMEKKKG